MLGKALVGISEAEAAVVWNALAQFVENGCDFVANESATPAEMAEQELAEALLDRLNAAVAKGA